MTYKNIAQAIIDSLVSHVTNKSNYTIKDQENIITVLNDVLTLRLKNHKQYSADSIWDCGWWNCCWNPNDATETLIKNIARQLHEKSKHFQTALTLDHNPIQTSGIQFNKGIITFPANLFEQYNLNQILNDLLTNNPETRPLLPPAEMTALRT